MREKRNLIRKIYGEKFEVLRIGKKEEKAKGGRNAKRNPNAKHR